MMLKALLAAGLIATAGFAPVAIAPADAQQRVVVRERTTVVRRGPGYRQPRWSNRRVCTRQWRNGRRVQVCRSVRYRR